MTIPSNPNDFVTITDLDALAWRYGKASNIVIANGKLVKWPDVNPYPTQGDVDAWETLYASFPTVADPTALYWKHPGKSIRTYSHKVTEWFGSMPTQAEVDQWDAEYAAYMDTLKTDGEIDAEMDAIMDAPEMKSIIEGIADFAPGPPGGLRDAIKARGRNNMPRGRA